MSIAVLQGMGMIMDLVLIISIMKINDERFNKYDWNFNLVFVDMCFSFEY